MSLTAQAAALTIDPEFRDLIPALSADERKQLEANLLADGCLAPIIVWANHDDTILDGHNRYEICVAHDIPFKTKALKFDSRDAAERWLIDNQLGRRNLSEAQRDYLLGKRYELEKGDREENLKKAAESPKDQNEPSGDTAERIGEEHGVSRETVKRASKFSEQLDAIGMISPDTKRAILADAVKYTKKDVATLAGLPKPDCAKACRLIAAGEAKSVKDAIKAIAKPKPALAPEELGDAAEPEAEAGTDQRGQKLPPQLAEVFSALPAMRKLQYELHRIKRETLALREKQPGAKHIHRNSFEAGVKQAVEAILRYEPYTICPYCKATGNPCEACCADGWVSRLVFNQAPAEMRT